MADAAVVSEVDRFLDKWWSSQRRMRRWLWITLLPFILSIVAPTSWSPFLTTIGLLILLLLLWPHVKMLKARSRRPMIVVLWLRRFHRGAQSRSLFRLWQEASVPWGQVITLTDQDVKRPTGLTTLTTLIAIGAPLVVELMSVHSGQMEWRSTFLSLALYALFACGFVGLITFISKKRSVTQVRKPEQVEKVLRHTMRMRSERLPFWSLGSGAVRCPPEDDQIWRSVIALLAPQVGAVILDYGEALSANVEWEVRTLLDACGPSRILLAVPPEANSPGGRGEIEARLRALFVSDFRPEVFVYPKKFPLYSLRFEAIVRPAQRLIGLAALHPAKASKIIH